jgi:hypothetical protein
MAELCAEFRVSEKTGYKWMARFRANGAAGLDDRSHAPHHVHRMADALATELLAIRHVHPTWGPRKLLAYAAARDTACAWPADAEAPTSNVQGPRRTRAWSFSAFLAFSTG